MYKHKMSLNVAKLTHAWINKAVFHGANSPSRVEVTMSFIFHALNDMFNNNRQMVFITGDSGAEWTQTLLSTLLHKTLTKIGCEFQLKKVRKQRNIHKEVTYGVELTIEKYSDYVVWFFKDLIFISTKEEKEKWENEDDE